MLPTTANDIISISLPPTTECHSVQGGSLSRASLSRGVSVRGIYVQGGLCPGGSLTFSPPPLKPPTLLRGARIDELADSNEPAKRTEGARVPSAPLDPPLKQIVGLGS